MSLEFPAVEVRVLGALMEKSVTTPDYYPLTLNSLTLACNQKNNREPVTDYDEDEVLAALDSLRDRGLAMRVDVSGARTAKFRHQISARWELSKPEFAILTVLFLRGAQTLGQLRARTERLYAFRDLTEVQDTLEAMQRREFEPQTLVRPLPLQPGSKEVRFFHAFSEPVAIIEEMKAANGFDAHAPLTDRATVRLDGNQELAELRTEVATLREMVECLQNELEAFKAQF